MFDLTHYNNFLSNSGDYFFGQDPDYQYISMTIDAGSSLDKALGEIAGKEIDVKYFNTVYTDSSVRKVRTRGGLVSYSIDYSGTTPVAKYRPKV